jgi:hypothetical protein
MFRPRRFVGLLLGDYFVLMSEQTCRGCGKPAPFQDTNALVGWAVVDQVHSELYCADCLTPSEVDCLATVEEQAAEDRLLLNRLPDTGRGVFVPQQRSPNSQPAAQRPVQ